MDWRWAFDGVNGTIPRTTGSECIDFIPIKRKWVESVIVTTICFMTFRLGMSRIKPIQNEINAYNYYCNNIDDENDPTMQQHQSQTTKSQKQHQQHKMLPHPDGNQQDNTKQYEYNVRRENKSQPMGKQILLIMMTFIFGLEIGFKFASRTVIYVLNPCHITTIIQIYLLASKPSKTATILFRIQMNYLNGPLLAFLFPETDSRLIPVEAAAYWIQHGLMFIIPIYLLRLGGAYRMEDFNDFNWNIMGYSLLLIYHFTVLQIFSLFTGVNLNHMLCAAKADPFDGKNYRLAACVHQAILCPILCKTCYLLFTPLPTPINKYYMKTKINDDTTDNNYHIHHQQQIITDNKCPVKKFNNNSLINDVKQLHNHHIGNNSEYNMNKMNLLNITEVSPCKQLKINHYDKLTTTTITTGKMVKNKSDTNLYQLGGSCTDIATAAAGIVATSTVVPEPTIDTLLTTQNNNYPLNNLINDLNDKKID